jgi:hypothetical protein
LPKEKSLDVSVFEAWGKEWVGAMVRGLSRCSRAFLMSNGRNFWSTRLEISPIRLPSFLRPRRGLRKLGRHSRTLRIVRGCRGGGKILFPQLFAQIRADQEAAAEAAKKVAEEETRREADAQERIEEDKRRRADEEHQLKIITLKRDASDHIDEAYEKVSMCEISYEEMKAIEQRVEAELACAMQELESGVEAGGKAAAGVRGDDMDSDVTPAAKDNTPPARKQVAK